MSVAQTLPRRSLAGPDIARMLASAACRSASRGSCVVGCVPGALTVFPQASVCGSVQIGTDSFKGHPMHMQKHETVNTRFLAYAFLNM